MSPSDAKLFERFDAYKQQVMKAANQNPHAGRYDDLNEPMPGFGSLIGNSLAAAVRHYAKQIIPSSFEWRVHETTCGVELVLISFNPPGQDDWQEMKGFVHTRDLRDGVML